MSSISVAVFGYGTLGKPLVSALAAQGAKVLLLSRDASKLQDVPATVKTASVDYTNEAHAGGQCPQGECGRCDGRVFTTVRLQRFVINRIPATSIRVFGRQACAAEQSNEQEIYAYNYTEAASTAQQRSSDPS